MTTFPYLYSGNRKEIVSGPVVIMRLHVQRAASGRNLKPITIYSIFTTDTFYIRKTEALK